MIQLALFMSLTTWNMKFVNVGCEVYNLGTGKGTSVLEMVAAFEKASGKVFNFGSDICSYFVVL